MLQNRSTQQITEYIYLLKRGKYFIIVPMLVSFIIGSAVAFKMPDVYRSDIKIFYMQAQVPEKMLIQSINMYFESAIIFIDAITFSKENSLKIIKGLNLYPDLTDTVSEDDLIEHMKEHYTQKAIYTEIPDKNGRTQEIIAGFELFFDHNNPQKAYRAVKVIATKFVDNYRSFREGFALQTSSFFEDEKLRLKEDIIKIDQEISKFKEKNINSLPELFESNYRMLETLNQKLLSLNQDSDLLKGKKINLESKLATANSFVSMEGISGQKIVSPEEKLTALKSEIKILRTTYSEKYPDVIRAKKEIEALEKITLEKIKSRSDNTSDADKKSSWIKRSIKDHTGVYNPVYVTLITQFEAVNLEIKSIKNEQVRIEGALQEYQHRIDRTPLVEKEYNALIRDLENAQRRYNELANQVLSLESSAAMEKRQMGGKLTIGKPASVPLRPIKPNRFLIIASSFVLGTGLGFLFLLGWDSLTQTVRTPQDFSKITRIPVLSEIPPVTTDSNRGNGGTLNYLKYSKTVLLLLFVFSLLYVIHVFYIEIDVLFIKMLQEVKTKLALSGL